ncbi:MAG: hypothetical protein CMH56_17215 [Myxococcales bacterium]|nr:hypothetical protein [Myxococcales bacterium]|tara:strand:+ start:531 stop:1190 length:660 start_codon:yes stop_codon:yes gene_type:complete
MNMKKYLFIISFALCTPNLASANLSTDMWDGWDIEHEEEQSQKWMAQRNGKKNEKKHKERREKRRAKVEKKIRTFLVVELTDALELSDELAVKLSGTIKTTQAEQHKLREKAHKQMEALKEMLEDEKSGDSALKKQADKARKAMKKARKMDEALFDAISQLLTPRQQAKLVLVGPKIQGKIHRMLQKARKGGHKGKGHRGPRGPGGPGGHRGPPPGGHH